LANTAHADLVLLNARVLIPSKGRGSGPCHAQAVAVAGDTIIAVGDNSQISGLTGHGARSIDCAGMTLIPGMMDAHCHVLAMAASLHGLDCGPTSVSSIPQLQELIQKVAGRTPQGDWIRGFGYDDGALSENRHPTRWDLDQATTHHPMRLDHRSGHASVLNSLGLELAGITRDTPDPVDGVIHRDQTTAEPTGLLLDMAGFLRRRLGAIRSSAEFDRGVETLTTKLLSYGITSVQDAGPSNGLDRWQTFTQLQERGLLSCRLTMMVGMDGASPMDEFQRAGLTWGSGDMRLRLGHAKIMLTLTTGKMGPDINALRELVAIAHGAGFPVAIHAVEQEAVEAAAQVIESEQAAHPTGVPPDRIEHCAECPPELVELVRRSGGSVVTQPGLIYWQGDEYNKRVEPWLLAHLYPVGALAQAEIPVAFASDAPVTSPNPWPAIHAAITRAARSGAAVPPRQQEGEADSQKVTVGEALTMYTEAGARSEGSQRKKGTIETGKLADLVLLDKNPFELEGADLAKIRPVMTIVGGKVVWER
jgi:predicted amidohydrolase YtcJ